MKITQLTISNVKRIRAIDITPNGTVQIVGGRNAQGKSSVLDAIWLALGGGAASKATARPIRDGETTATVRLDLGDYLVTRTWTGDKSTLTVTSPDGAKFSSPQKKLDGLIGSLSFDPFAFTLLPAKAQRDQLLSLVDLPFDPADLDRRRAAIFDERTEVGRQGKAIGDIPALDPDAPTAEVSSAGILAELRQAEEDVQRNEAVHLEAGYAQTDRETAERAVEDARIHLEIAITNEKIAVDNVLALRPLPDVTAIEQRLASVDDTNRAVRANQDAVLKQAQHKRLTAQYTALGEQLAALDREKAAGLEAATFPVPGLGFDTDGVTYQDVPFSQASSAEQIRVSLAMAMALNPELRVIRILDGSLLDTDNLALIANMADEHDYQLWIERVGDADADAIIIEDGQVRA